jgi:uncharacterized protein
MRYPRSLTILAALALITAGGTALSQVKMSPSTTFLEAVKEGDGDKVNQLLQNPNFNAINARDPKTGETALHFLTQDRNTEWLRVIVSRGGNPNLGDNKGEMPLHIAAQLNYVDGAQVLIKGKAKVDGRNNAGETPLIRAVRFRHVDMVKLLMKNGANPDLTENETGRSARDYATEDPRGRAVLSVIESGGKDVEPSKSAPTMDFGGDFTPIKQD